MHTHTHTTYIHTYTLHIYTNIHGIAMRRVPSRDVYFGHGSGRVYPVPGGSVFTGFCIYFLPDVRAWNCELKDIHTYIHTYILCARRVSIHRLLHLLPARCAGMELSVEGYMFIYIYTYMCVYIYIYI